MGGQMKFKSPLWQNELGFLPFKAINIFVGRYFNQTSELLDHIHTNELGETYTFLGSEWYYVDVAEKLREVFVDVPTFAHVNSIDVINKIPQVVKELGMKDDFQLIRIGTSARASNRGDTVLTYLSWSIVDTMVKMHWEMR